MCGESEEERYKARWRETVKDFMMVSPGSKQSGIVFSISHVGLSIPQPVGQREYQSLRTLIPLMRCYKVGKRERWGGESGGRDTERKKTSK